MTWDRKRYHENYDALALICKEQAGWKCEKCGAVNGAELVGKKRGNAYKVRISAAHLDHDPENPNPRLMAMCEACHLRYDRFEHGKNSHRTMRRKQREAMRAAGQLDLFLDEQEAQQHD